MAVPKEWLSFLREQFPEGSRIKLREMNSGADAPPPGSIGTLERITDEAGFCVAWDNGRYTELALGTDSFSVLPPELQTEQEQFGPKLAEGLPEQQQGGMTFG